ncbi:hypothetical protein WCLP8_4290001 [uncultured Gammaproteobacteria bacterium]
MPRWRGAYPTPATIIQESGMSTKIRKTGQYQTKTAIKAAYQKGRQAARQCQLDWELEWDKDTKRQLKEIQRIADPEARAKEFQ